MTQATKKLFRLTNKRTLLLSDILTKINLKLESKEVESFSWLCIENHPRLSNNEKQVRFDCLKKEWDSLCLYHDVLETVACHTNENNRTFLMKQERPWKNEWEIPLDLFNETMDFATDLIQTTKERSQPKFRANYDEQLSFLVALKTFRNTGS